MATVVLNGIHRDLTDPDRLSTLVEASVRYSPKRSDFYDAGAAIAVAWRGEVTGLPRHVRFAIP